MSHQTFKVSIVIDDSIENFYIKHYIDDFQPIFGKFKNLVFQRNPLVNSPTLKIYWIDGENDKILISCEEDFRLYIEQGQGKKIFFNVTSKNFQPQAEEENDEPMEAEDERQKCDRKSRKSARDEEKQRRASKRLAEKMRHAEEKVKAEEERRSRHPEKYSERKNAERLEKARKRCEQIRQILYGSTDPANLHDASPTSNNAGASTSGTSAYPSIDESLAVLHPSAETVRLLSNAIAGCLQPCNLINKILSEIIGMIPTPAGEDIAPRTPLVATGTDQQQQTEIPSQNIATNTSSFLNTPKSVAHPSSQEIEALFKEAAKELEKMNEIVQNGKSMESSIVSLGSSSSAITQVEKIQSTNTGPSASDNIGVSQQAVPADNVDSRSKSPDIENDFKILSPPKSMRSRESSIEVHDVNSMMSDDSRDWTLLDANEQDDGETSALLIPPTSLNTTFASAVGDVSSINSATAETQTPSALLIQSEAVAMTPSEVRSSIQKSIEAVGELNQMVKDSVELAQQSLETIQKPVEAPPVLRLRNEVNVEQPTVCPEPIQAETSSATFAPQPSAPRYPPLGTLSALTQANLNANRLSTGARPKTSQVGPAVIVYDPNPKINTAVHTMIAMGFSNEGGWLTQLLLNVDGDVPKAIQFLTPQPKPNKQ